ncbi:hypothetical protein OCH239_21120 [Roseivivax halodurans JCM 10272]|uniref:Uncharacterized protein n=1 Tax=Roseivivax halodurans JCM 10272 TaxID=1449350 RepID=X7EG81_9RHOB|nr:hypothetical protein [Roseivivax halodurans]ETX14897.1 hypothetical protein OCH239_21120 [Roseivivax halodurans JCM 10272]
MIVDPSRHGLSGPRASLEAQGRQCGGRLGDDGQAVLRITRGGAQAQPSGDRTGPRIPRGQSEIRPFVGETVEMRQYSTTSVTHAGAEG